MCRRCGAPLHHDVEDARLTLPPALNRRRAIAGVATRPVAAPGRTPADAAATAAAAASALAFQSPTPDTLLPGAMPRPDNLLPRATRSRAALPTSSRPASSRPAPTTPGRRGRPSPAGAISVVRKHWRRALVLVVVAVALVMSCVAAWPVVFGPDAAPAASSASQQARAISLLRTVVGGGRTLYAPKHSFTKVSASALSARSYKVRIVGAAQGARVGQVSMRVTSASVLTLATPADATRCVFARDEPSRTGTRFALVRTADCRAAAAPATGWGSR